MKEPKIVGFIYPMSPLDKLKLEQSFGETTFKAVGWHHPTNSSEVEKLIHDEKPDLIMAFGYEQKKWLITSLEAEGIEEMYCHHPSEKMYDANDLFGFAVNVGAWRNAWQLEQEIAKDLPIEDPNQQKLL
jgi:hypothetical protein